MKIGQADMLTVNECADIVGVTRTRMHQLIQAYKIPTKRFGQRVLMIDRRDIEKLAKKDRPNGVNRRYSEPLK